VNTPVAKERLARHIRELYQWYAFQATDNSPAYPYSSRDEWGAQALLFHDRVVSAMSRLSDATLRAAEAEAALKLTTFWRDKGLGSIVQDAPLINRNEDQAAYLRPWMRALGTQLASIVRHHGADVFVPVYNNAVVPIDRGKGSPFWLPGTDHSAAIELHALWQGCNDVSDYVKRLHDSGPVKTRICLTGYIRIQDAGGEVPAWVWTGDRVEQRGSRLGPKVRKVQAMPFGLNSMMAGAAECCRFAATMLDDRNSGTLGPAMNAARTSQFTIAIDLSKYDESVSAETIAQFRSVVMEPFCRALRDAGVISGRIYSILLSIDEMNQTIPFLAPPHRMEDGAELVDTDGMIKSGERWTSLKGTLINRCLRDAQLSAAKWSARAFNSGDDTLVCGDGASGRDRFLGQLSQHGFVEKVAASPTYLMRHMPSGYAYLGRMLGGCLNKEANREPSGVAHAAAAIQIRRGLLNNHPAQPAFDAALADAENPLRAAVALSRSASVADLLLLAARDAHRTPQSTYKVEELLDLASEAIEGRLLTAQSANALQALIAGDDPSLDPDDRANLRFFELERESKTVGPADAQRRLRKKTA